MGNYFCSAFIFNSKSIPDSNISNAVLSAASIPLMAQASYLTTTMSWSIAPGVINCLQLIMSHPRYILDSTPTPCGMIETTSRATLGRSIYFDCVSSFWCHQSVISGIQHALVIAIGWEWTWFWFWLTWPQCFCNSCGKVKLSIGAVSTHTARVHSPGVISVTCLGITYSSFLLDNSYRSVEHWPDAEAAEDRKRLSLGLFWVYIIKM